MRRVSALAGIEKIRLQRTEHREQRDNNLPYLAIRTCPTYEVAYGNLIG
jgi:hypothetical protein